MNYTIFAMLGYAQNVTAVVGNSTDIGAQPCPLYSFISTHKNSDPPFAQPA